MQQVDHDIYYENSFSGVTLGAIVLPLGAILVDAPLRAEDSRAWRAALHTIDGNSNRILVNLDAHPDRTLGARAMECTIIAHQKTALVFRGRPLVFKGQNAESGSDWEAYDDAVGIRWAFPDITFSQSISLHWGPSEVILEHHAGPAPGAIWVIVPASKVVFVGDTVLADQPPFLANADLPAWLDSLGVLLASYRDYIIISGRDGPLNIEVARNQQRYLRKLSRSLEKAARQNAPLEALDKLVPDLLADLDFPTHLEEQYRQRLRHGLLHYYARSYRPIELPND